MRTNFISLDQNTNTYDVVSVLVHECIRVFLFNNKYNIDGDCDEEDHGQYQTNPSIKRVRNSDH